MEVVVLTTSDAAGDENFVKIITFPFLCNWENVFTEILLDFIWREEMTGWLDDCEHKHLNAITFTDISNA